MLVYMSQYVDDHAASPSPSAARPPVKAPAPKPKKGKINFVSKASLAIFDPRHAMGIDTGRDWYEAEGNARDSRSSFDHASQRRARYSEDRERTHKWTTSPTPELEAFTTSMDDYAHGSHDPASLEMTRQPSASSSVFEDDRDAPEMPARRRFYSRKSVAASASNTPTSATFPADDLLFSPLGTKPKPSRSAGASVNPGSSSSSLARFFTRKKKDKATHLSGLASRSTPDLFDGVPQSAPPTTLTFEQSGFTFSPQRKGSSGSSLHEMPSSLPTSPERAPVRLVHDFSPSRTSPLSTKKSMPALRQIREAQNAAGGRSITFATPEERPRPRQSAATARPDLFDAAPALPPLPSFDTSSPMIPLEFAWDSKRGTVRESQMPSLGATRPVSRVVSSTGRGVPSPGLNPIRLNDLRKSTITLRNEPVLRIGDEGRSPTRKSTASPRRNANPSPANPSPTASAKRLSMAQRVVDGLLDQNHGREEPEMRARRSDMEVRAARRRSRSADGRTIPALKLHDYASPPSSNSHSDSVFPAFVRHAPVGPGRANSPQPRFFADDRAAAITPTPKQVVAFASASPASPASPATRVVARSSSPGRSSQRQAAAPAETHQARRVNFAGQRTKAVAVASPLLLSRSPRMAGRSGTPLPVVNIMPPTPDLAATSEDHERQEDTLQRYESVVGHSSTVEAVSATVASEVRALPPRSESATPTPRSEPAPVAPAKQDAVQQPTPASPESVYSPVSVYSPEESQSTFAPLLAALVDGDEAVSKEQVAITADSVAAELSYAGMPRTESVTSQLSEADSHRSSSSGAFAFSRSMSSTSLASGGTFSSASSNASESPERRMKYLPSLSSFEFSPTKMTSSASLASTAGTSIFELEAEMRGTAASKGDATGIEALESSDVFGHGTLKTAFQLKGAGAPAAQDSSDCDTPTLASCRQMGATAAPVQGEEKAAGRQLGLSMDLSELAQELGLGRLSQLGLGNLKGVESLAEKPADKSTEVARKTSPVKPPKSSARAAAGTSLSRFAAGMNDIASSAAMSPLPVSIAGRSPQTPPRTKIPLADPLGGPKVSASGVPKTEGGFGLGLNFVESPSPQQPRKASVAPGSYDQLVAHLNQPQAPAQLDDYQDDEPEWVGVAM